MFRFGEHIHYNLEVTIKMLKKILKSKIVTLCHTYNDYKRFSKYAATGFKSKSRENVRSKLMYYTHQIEKGLSRSNFRPNFGDAPILNLSKVMEEWLKLETDKQDIFFLNALAVMKNYFLKHEILEIETDKKRFFSEQLLELIMQESDFKLSSTIKVKKVDKDQNHQHNFHELAMKRYSVREYSTLPVDANLLIEAIKIAQKSPSVCNRQSARIHIVENLKKIEEILEVQSGFKGYLPPNKLVIITSDIRTFLKGSERTQSYIDGGLFAMSLMYALEFLSLASVPLSTMLSPKNEKKFREIAQIPEHENLIMVIAIGHFLEEVEVPTSLRNQVETITTYKNKSSRRVIHEEENETIPKEKYLL